MPQLRNFKKGQLLEKQLSKKVHQLGIPLLIDQTLLRSFGCGQVDVARIVEGESNQSPLIQIFEVKSSRYPSRAQLNRLNKTCTLLGHYLDLPVQLKIVVGSEVDC